MMQSKQLSRRRNVDEWRLTTDPPIQARILAVVLVLALSSGRSIVSAFTIVDGLRVTRYNEQGSAFDGLSVAVDRDGAVSVAYTGPFMPGDRRNSARALKYAVLGADTWSDQFIDRSGYSPSLLYDVAGIPHIVYYSDWSGDHGAKYATGDSRSGDWSTEVADRERFFPQVAYDSKTRPHIAFVSVSGPHKLWHAVQEIDGRWQTDLIGNVAQLPPAHTIAIDGEDRPHVFYSEKTEGLAHAVWDSGHWVTEALPGVTSEVKGLSSVTDSQGNIHLSFYDHDNRDILYANNVDGSWSIEVADNAAYSRFPEKNTRTTIKLLPDGTPVIAYLDHRSNEVRFARKSQSGLWDIAVVDGGLSEPSMPSMAIGSDGLPVIAYITGKTYKVALTDPSTPLQPGDANQDRWFDQADIIAVLQAGKYMTGEPASWSQGDWGGGPGGFPGFPPPGDGLFNQFDIIAAQQAGTYGNGPYAAVSASAVMAVPEPEGFVLLACGVVLFTMGIGRSARANWRRQRNSALGLAADFAGGGSKSRRAPRAANHN